MATILRQLSRNTFNMTKKILILALLIPVLQNCKKESNSDLQKFDMIYNVKFVGDENIYSIQANTSTTFPIENETSWIGQGKFNDEQVHNENHLNSLDSIYLIPDLKVYYGCTKYIQIRIWFKTGTNVHTYRDYFFGPDTIKNFSNSRFTFIWPNDSARYEFNQVSY